MKHPRVMSALSIGLALLAGLASLLGIYSKGGPGSWEHISIHGQSVLLYGKGLYQWMPADVAIQGIAQDYITLWVAIPLLLIAFWRARKGSARGAFVFAGVSGYFFVTYLFYLMMASYSSLFLLHASLLTLSFFALFLSVSDLLALKALSCFSSPKLMKWAGGFLFFNSLMVALLWLSIVVPPLLDGSIYPRELYHFTTLVVQGLDLSLLLPIAIVIGFLAWRGKESVFPYLTVYLVFLTLLMLALCSKIFFMAQAGHSVIPVVFIMPTVCVIAGFFSFKILGKTP